MEKTGVKPAFEVRYHPSTGMKRTLWRGESSDIASGVEGTLRQLRLPAEGVSIPTDDELSAGTLIIRDLRTHVQVTRHWNARQYGKVRGLWIDGLKKMLKEMQFELQEKSAKGTSVARTG